MSEFITEPENIYPPVTIGEILPNFLDVAQDKRGAHLVNEVIPSSYGDLYFDLAQFRNNTTRWVTNHGEVVITCDISTGEVTDIDTEAQEMLMQQDPEIYGMGMKAFTESLSQAE